MEQDFALPVYFPKTNVCCW